MGVMEQALRSGAVIVAGLMLAACLVSDEPLLDAKNGHATALEPGVYLGCSYTDDNQEPECHKTSVTRDETGLYSFRAEGDDETLFMRFRRLAHDAWLAQLSEDEDEDYFYFLAERSGEKFALTMIECKGVPETVRNRYAARGEMEVDDEMTTCRANTLRAVIASAKAFRAAGKPESNGATVYTPITDEDA